MNMDSNTFIWLLEKNKAGPSLEIPKEFREVKGLEIRTKNGMGWLIYGGENLEYLGIAFDWMYIASDNRAILTARNGEARWSCSVDMNRCNYDKEDFTWRNKGLWPKYKI